MRTTKLISKPAAYRVGLLPPHDSANLKGLPSLLRCHFKIDRRGMTLAWACISDEVSCELGVYTREIAETKLVQAQVAAVSSGVEVLFFMEQLPVPFASRRS